MARSNSTESRLQERIDSFVDEISAIVREAAVEAVREALAAGGSAPARRAAPPARGRATKKVSRKRTASGRRIRRSAEDLERIGAQVLAHVKSHPGQRLEEIGSALRVDTADLKRPVQLLLQAKAMRTEGQRRGTKYFAGKGAAKGAAKKKARKAPAKRKAKKRAKRS